MNLKEKYTDFYRDGRLGKFPNEYVVRMFLGAYPNINLSAEGYDKKSICDVGCGDGRNLRVFAPFDMSLFGTEITEEISIKVQRFLAEDGIVAEIKKGESSLLPYENETFDFVLVWNSCYYMNEQLDFSPHVMEYSRIMKPSGHLVFSIPKPSNFIFEGAKEVSSGFVEIDGDPFGGIRNGEIMRFFSSEQEIEQQFSCLFSDFIFGSIEADCFGLKNDHFIGVCRKK